MRFLSSLIIFTTLLLVTSCHHNKVEIKPEITDNKLSVKVGGADISVSYNDNQVEELEKKNADLTKQLEAVKAQLAAKDTLLADEIKKLQEQMGSLLEQSQKLTQQLSTLKRERAAREAAEQKAPQAKAIPKPTAPSSEDTVRSTALIENRTGCKITVRVMSDSNRWQSFTIPPNRQLTFERNGDAIEVQFLSDSEWVEATLSDQSEVAGYYFSLDEDGELDLLYDE
jgi:hypothetical protein